MARGRGRNAPEIVDDEDDDDVEEDEYGELESDIEEDDDDDDQDPLAHLPAYVLSRVERLQDLEAAREAIMVDYLKERAAMEKKFEGLFQPLYADRAKIVRGELDEEIAATAAAAAAGNSRPADEETEGGERVKGVPQFWACAMTHMENIGELITAEDVDCLERLTNITCVDRDDGKGFTLAFYFAPNDYFTNSILTKTYDVPNLLISDEAMLKKVVGEAIHWKPGKSLMHKTVKKKQRGKGKHAGQVRTVAKEEERESFFHWFTPPVMPASADTMDEEEADRLEEIFDCDYEVAQAFRCHVIPKAVLWFTGQVSAFFNRAVAVRRESCVKKLIGSLPSLLLQAAEEDVDDAVAGTIAEMEAQH